MGQEQRLSRAHRFVHAGTHPGEPEWRRTRKALAPLIAAMFFSLPAHAHDCSGGTGGGMDATGNQCNDAAAVATLVSSSAATVSSTPAPKVAERGLGIPQVVADIIDTACHFEAKDRYESAARMKAEA